MHTNRIHHRTAVALVSAVGLLFALGVQGGSSAVATGTSDADTGTSLQGKVRIHLRGYIKGSQFAAFGRGRFTASGAITDHGRFVDEFQGVHPPNEPHVRTLRGAKGTIQIMVDGGGCGTDCVPRSPRWRVTERNEGVCRASGAGDQEGEYRFVGIDATMIGAVWR